jgi:hypothetical protein
VFDFIAGRGRGIRTPGPLLPKQVLYQAELCPDGIGHLFQDTTSPRAILHAFRGFEMLSAGLISAAGGAKQSELVAAVLSIDLLLGVLNAFRG